MSIAAVSLASMAVAAAGSLVQGVSQSGQARRSAKAADANADEALRQGQAEAGLIRERARRAKGSNLANIGASGVDISGSFADALEDSDINAEIDAQTAVRNSKMQANNFKAQAKADRSSGTSALIGGAFGAGTQALSGYGNWKLLKSYGAGSPSADSPWAVPAGGHGGAR